MVLDLRDNPGGFLNLAVSMSNLFSNEGFMDSNPIVYVKYRNKTEDDKGDLLNRGKFRHFKVLILANGGTASASEIVTAYLKNYCDALVIGERTFGKGVGQNVLPMPNAGTLTMTTFEYFVGKNMVSVNKVGIKPDYEVKNSENGKTDLQLQKALELATGFANLMK